MRTYCSAVLIFLIASGVSLGQVPEEWDKWLADGLAAEEAAEYKVAEKLLGQACDVSLAKALGPERFTQTCLKLSGTYSVQGKWDKAADVTRTLVEAQAQFADATPERRAEALIRSAEADMADGENEAATQSIQRAIDLAREMDPEPAAAAFADIAELYAAGGPKGFGSNLLEAALRTLMAQPKKDTVLYVATATKVGWALGAFERWEDATKLLLPLVEAAEKRVDTKPEHDELWKAYNIAATTAITAFKMLGDDKQADRVRELQDGWPRVLTVGPGQLLRPRLTHDVEPKYPPGAKSMGIQGVVVLSLTIGVDGRAHDIQVLKGLPYGLSWSAVGAIHQWRFKPATRNGKPEVSQAQVEVHFRLR